MRKLGLLICLVPALMVVGCSKGVDDTAATSATATSVAAPANKPGASAGASPKPMLANPDAIPQMGSKTK